ncbi:ATP-binding protein [Ureibacillus terrenus]|uniref:histidine kinase n=1 Tax=Ureibacillus terrenus TaxID=118246 RepID=A0A540UXI5_9BACL|nr:ATP-binding protein [Ureibacillus terrenus]MED3763406.1 ATP-binding protein [Ureibacillus terrenus]TQE89209.1 GHKL domain-containing protein [Ureibacillus terrenus]
MEQKKFIDRNDALLIFIVAIITAVASEVKVIPFEGAPFRFGLGTVMFFLAALISPLPLIYAGFATGMVIALFRTMLDVFIYESAFTSSLISHLPAGLFYILFALGLHMIKLEKFKSKPFLLASWVTIIEFASNSIEQLTTSFFITNIPITIKEVLLLLLVAVLRSFFVVGIYSSITVKEQKRQVQQLLNFISTLYVEALYLKKSMNEIEKITAESYSLYDELKNIDLTLSMKALNIAQEIHEVKKDEQRIYAGLSKILNMEPLDAYFISELLQFVKEANEKYSEMLNKQIDFMISYNEDFRTNEHIPLLALINNLVANAVEAIEEKGVIHISINTGEDDVIISVEDTGVGIPENLIPVIFDAGFTTKYNREGVPSTGIGLSHVQAIVEKLNGTIHVESDQTTKFTIHIPIQHLQKGDVP